MLDRVRGKTDKICPAFNLPEGFSPVWHRGNVSQGQENCEKALRAAMESEYPHVEVDAVYFENDTGQAVGLLSHDLDMEQLTREKGKFADFKGVENLPLCNKNKNLSPEKFLTVIDFFDLLLEYKKRGVTILADLELKEDTGRGEIFGRWVGQQLAHYGLQKAVFVSSFFYSNMKGVKETCPDCLHGANIYENQRFLGLLFKTVTLFDIFHPLSKHKNVNVINIQDKILLNQPEIAEHWLKKRGVNFVSMFSSDPERIYSNEELQLITIYARWGEFDPKQMQGYREFSRKAEAGS